MAWLWLTAGSVKSRVLTLLGFALAAWVTLLPGFGEAPVATEPLGAPVPAAEAAVRIEHEFVTVPEVRQPVRAPGVRPPAARRVAPPAPVSRARATERVPPAPLARARRVLFGDGTYRPQPFPRPSR
jgi:hypothetical protein